MNRGHLVAHDAMSWDRLTAPVATVAVPTGLTLLLYGQPYAALAVAIAVGGLFVATRRRRRRPHDEIDWRARSGPRASTTMPARGSVTRPLALVEARELILSPWFGAGVGFCVLFASVAVTSFERSWWLSAAILPLLVHPLCGMTIIATHRNVSRARRDGAEELFRACPASEAERTAGHLLTAVVPVVVAAVFVITTLAGAAIALDHIYGPFDERVVGDAVLAGLLLPAGATALGVLLGRRARFALAPFVVLPVIALLDLEMWDRGYDGRGWLATGLPSGKVDFIYLAPPVAGRLLWIGGLALLVAGLTFARGERLTTTVVSIGSAVALVGLLLTVRPLSDATVDRLTEYVLAPASHEVCQTLSNDVEICALEPYRDHGADLAAYLAPVADAIPAGAFDRPVTMRLLVGDGLEQLPSQVQERIVPTPIPPGTVPLTFGHNFGSLDEARFVLAATAVGLPTGENAPESLLVDGQARGVIMLWLATSGLAEQEANDVLRPDEYNDNTPTGQGHVWPGTCTSRVQWAPQDLTAARSLIAIAPEAVEGLLVADWSHWTEADTSTDELLHALGLPTVGPADPIEPLGSTC